MRFKNVPRAPAHPHPPHRNSNASSSRANGKTPVRCSSDISLEFWSPQLEGPSCNGIDSALSPNKRKPAILPKLVWRLYWLPCNPHSVRLRENATCQGHQCQPLKLPQQNIPNKVLSIELDFGWTELNIFFASDLVN